ncbi:O-antigen ligase family protein [Aliiroseovarius sp. PrR006]|nr:O-antigen ligase family protein [Aliiroseovarius sp. PrR006]NDW52446.1 O-antigen ligase family protein [Aliiroseovarius sp. PrR006]
MSVAFVATVLVATAYTLVLLSSSKMLFVLFYGTAFCALATAVLGNLRLAVLVGLIMVAPLSIGKDFLPMPHMGGASSFAIEAADLFLGVLLLFQLRDLVQKRRPFVLPSGSAGLIAMIAVGVVHMAVGPSPLLASHQVFQMMKDLMLFFVVTNELVRVRQFRIVFWAFMATLCVQSGIGILQYVKQSDLGLQILGELDAATLEIANFATYGKDGAVFRISALLGHPNLFGAFVSLLFSMAVASFSYKLPAFQRSIIVFVTFLGAAALLLTLSRSAWVSGAFGVLVLMCLSVVHPQWRSRGLPIALFIAIGGIIVMIPALPVIIQRFVASDSGAVDFRIEWMLVAWDMIKNNWVEGVGLNTFVFHLPNNTPYGGADSLTQRFGPNWPVVHNIYLLIWSEMGTFGFIAFMYTMLVLFYIAYDNLRYVIDPHIYALSIGAAGGLGAVMLDGLASFFLRNPQCGRMFWIVAATLVAAHVWNKRNAPLRTGATPDQNDAVARVRNGLSRRQRTGA